MLALYVWLQTWLEKQEGQDLIEYAAIVALLVIAAVGTLGVAGNSIKTVFSQIGSWVATLEF
jgi:Flp pilus assembly pilin Flp